VPKFGELGGLGAGTFLGVYDEIMRIPEGKGVGGEGSNVDVGT